MHIHTLLLDIKSNLDNVRMWQYVCLCITYGEQHGSVFLQAGGLDPSDTIRSSSLELRWQAVLIQCLERRKTGISFKKQRPLSSSICSLGCSICHLHAMQNRIIKHYKQAVIISDKNVHVFNVKIGMESWTCVSENARLKPAAREPVTLARPNFSIHSSIKAGGAFLWATTTLPQNNTSNFLAKAVAASAVVVVEQDAFVWPLLGRDVGASSCREELLPACRRVLMISGTWRDNCQRNKSA